MKKIRLFKYLENRWKNEHFLLPWPTPELQASEGTQLATSEYSRPPLENVGNPCVFCSPDLLEQPRHEDPRPGTLEIRRFFENPENHWKNDHSLLQLLYNMKKLVFYKQPAANGKESQGPGRPWKCFKPIRIHDVFVFPAKCRVARNVARKAATWAWQKESTPEFAAGRLSNLIVCHVI